MTKTQQVVQLIAAGDRKAALKLASDFRMGVNAQQRRILKVGYECYHFESTYRQMGVNVEDAKEKAWNLLNMLDCLKEKASV